MLVRQLLIFPECLLLSLGSGLVMGKCTFLAFCPYNIHLDKA